MLHAGLFAGQRLELIDGELIDKMGQNPPHAHVIEVLMDLLRTIFGKGRVRIQLPIEAATPDRERSSPEPDAAVLANVRDDHRYHPRGEELLLAIEVADTTIQFDATVKRDLYARAGVPEYWVIDINTRRVIVHKNPSQGKFQEVVTLPENATASVSGAQIAISELLP